eukprot:1726008-Amphidinium_carterae.1
MSQPAQGTPLPPLILNPAGPVPQNMDLTPVGAPFQPAGYEPNLGTGPAVTQMLPPPLPPHAIQPLSGRGCPYGPTGRAP